MAIVGLVIGVALGLFAAAFIFSAIAKIAQIVLFIIARLALSIFYNVAMLISLLVALAIVAAFGQETSVWLLLLAPIAGFTGALFFLGAAIKDVTRFFSPNHTNESTDGY